MRVLVTEKISEHKYKTPEGYLICVDAILARTGKQSYMRSELFDTDDETEVEVDRKPEEVFSPQTLASFENKPITKNHPDEDVNSENIKEYSVGFVRDVHKGYDNGQPVILGTLVIQDAETIKEIEDGEYTQLSCGYNCDVVDEENPQQKCIRGNHIALCEQGRAGNARIVDSKIKKDSNLSEVVKFLKQNLFNFDIYYNKINFDSTEEMKNAVELLRKYGYKYDIYNSNSIIVEDSKMKKDELYTLEELRKMRIGNYKEIDIYRIGDKFSTNPNTSKERFDTFEEVKKYIDNGFRDSIKDVEPRADEDKDEFISRFMRETKEEYPDEKQRLAIAYSYWNKKSTKDEESTYTEVTKELEKNYDNFVEDDDISSLPDRIEKEKFNELYYKLRDKFENKWNYRVSTYGDKFKIEIAKAVGAAKGTYGPVGGKWVTVKTIYSKDSVNDSKTVYIKELKKGDTCKDPYYNDEYKIEEILDDGYYRVRSLESGKIFTLTPRKQVVVDSVKDSKLTLDQIINIYKMISKKKQ